MWASFLAECQVFSGDVDITALNSRVVLVHKALTPRRAAFQPDVSLVAGEIYAAVANALG
jgi:hypothetical protein